MLLRKAVLFLILMVSTSYAYADNNREEASNKKHPNSYYYKQFQEVFERVERDYVQDPDYQKMTDAAINGMLQSLDPYSEYYTDDDLEFFINNTEGEFGGIGVEIVYESGAIKVISPIDDLPAYNAGVRAGDYILGINGKLVSNLGFNKAVKEMRGTPGTKLNLLILKEDDDKPREVELTREVVKTKPVKYHAEFDEVGVIGYARISVFNNSTSGELKKAIKDIENQAKNNNSSLKGIILDLRSNPGGVVDQAAAVAEYFLDHGTIVTAKGKSKEHEMMVTAGRFVQKAPKVPMVVLVNSGSASSSEILAGALQDHKRAIIMGTNSFGKGLVQTFTRISPRSGLKITTQRYYTPNGRSIDSKGIEPDIYIQPAKVEFAEKEHKDKRLNNSSVKSYLNKYNKEEKADNSKDDGKQAVGAVKPSKPEHEMSETYKKDYQYARAYDLIRGLIVNESKNKDVQ